MVRKVFHISGNLIIDALGHILQIVLNRAAPLASILVESLPKLLASARVVISLGEHEFYTSKGRYGINEWDVLF